MSTFDFVLGMAVVFMGLLFVVFAEPLLSVIDLKARSSRKILGTIRLLTGAGLILVARIAGLRTDHQIRRRNAHFAECTRTALLCSLFGPVTEKRSPTEDEFPRRKRHSHTGLCSDLRSGSLGSAY